MQQRANERERDKFLQEIENICRLQYSYRSAPDRTKTIGTFERLAAIQKVYTKALQNKDRFEIDDKQMTALKVALIQELFANAKIHDAKRLWKELDQTIYTDEWMQNTSLVWLAWSNHPSAREGDIDFYILQHPNSLIGYRAKLFRLLNGNLSSNASNKKMMHVINGRVVPKLSSKIRGAQNREKAREVVKHILTTFPIIDRPSSVTKTIIESYSTGRSRSSRNSSVTVKEYGTFHFDQIVLAFRLYCLLSETQDRQDVVKTFDTLLGSEFFKTSKNAERTKDEMIKAFEELDQRIKNTSDKNSQKALMYKDRQENEIFQFPFKELNSRSTSF